MRPHMAHFQNTLIKKKLAEKAGERDEARTKYMASVEKARAAGYTNEAIAEELATERERIRKDIRIGDSLFLKGVENAQRACIATIDEIISELKGETNVIHSNS